MNSLRSYYSLSCGNAKDDDPNDWYDCEGYGSY